MDKDHIAKLIGVGGSPKDLAAAQGIAKKALADAGLPPKNACAATLSAMLQLSGIDVPMTLGAGKLAHILGGRINSRHWDHLPVGDQQAGDVGVCFDNGGVAGADHIYLVVQRLDEDEMLIADNQKAVAHQRFASGHGKTPTEYFLRAPGYKLDLRRSFHPVRSIDQILQIAAGSEIAHYPWNNRGVAPAGYLKGMALVYARVYCKLKAGDAAATEMAKKDTGDNAKDALAWYRQQFLDAGMDNSSSGPDTLRHLFVLLIGLGMRESSGRYCEGRDRSASNTNSNNAEAGLFQTSYNARTASPLLPRLFMQYANATDFVDIFKEGVKCKAADLENYGTGDGKEFQRLSKACPPFAAEFAAVALRNLRKHWGPINRREAQIRRECDMMLMQVQNAVDASNLCPVILSSPS
jgi:hypothetical protein